VDARRTGHVAVVLGLGAVMVTAVFLVVAGIGRNTQIDRLRHHGVPVEVTVTGCRGLLGGSGSNGAGYACQGTFVLDGRRYRRAVPGNRLLAPGSQLSLLTVGDDPGLLADPTVVEAEHPSARVFVLPAVLFTTAVAAGALALRRRKAQTALRSVRDPAGGGRRGEGAGGV
jgi:hypothetical protein